MDDRTPPTEVPDVFVSSRTIDELQQRRGPPVEDREEQPEAEGIGELPDRSAEIPRRFSSDLTQRPGLFELSGPDRSVDVSSVRTLWIVKILRQPAFAGGVLAGDHAGNHWNRKFLQDRQVVRRPAHDLA